MSYQKTNWQNLPNTITPVNATNLNKIEQQLYNEDLLNVPSNIIAANSDLNTFTTPGVYLSETASISSTLSNSPISNSAFKLKVEHVNRTDRIRQTIYGNDINASTYIRYNNGSWGKWQKITEGMVHKGNLANNTDLNNVTETGIYYTAGATLTNAPAEYYSWQVLQVIQSYAGMSVYQMLISPGTTYIRQFAGDPGTWGKWRKYTATDETVLYSNNSGSGGNILLSQSVNDFNYIEIYGEEIGNRNVFIKLQKKDSFVGRKFALSSTFYSDGSTYIRTTTYTINNTQLVENDTAQTQFTNSSTSITTGTSQIKITKVVGYV